MNQLRNIIQTFLDGVELCNKIKLTIMLVGLFIIVTESFLKKKKRESTFWNGTVTFLLEILVSVNSLGEECWWASQIQKAKYSAFFLFAVFYASFYCFLTRLVQLNKTGRRCWWNERRCQEVINTFTSEPASCAAVFPTVPIMELTQVTQCTTQSLFRNSPWVTGMTSTTFSS